MTERVSLLLEILSFLLVLHHLHGRRPKPDIATAVFVSFDVLVFQMINQSGLESWTAVSVYVAAVGYAWFCFGDSLRRAVFGVAAAMVITGFVQICVALVGSSAAEGLGNPVRQGFVINLLTLLAVILVSGRVKMNGVLKLADLGSRILRLVLLSASAAFLLGMVLYKRYEGLTFSEYILLVAVAVIMYLSVLQWKQERRVEQERERQMRMQAVYHQSFEVLLSEVRDRQHEFKNHLTVLFGLHYTCDTYEELVRQQAEYGRQLMENSRFHSLLYSCGNPAAAGFLYQKFLEAEQKGIEVEYHVVLGKETADLLQIFDVIEILGILLDNAMEAEGEKEEGTRRLCVTVKHDDRTIMLRIRNVYRPVQPEELERFFKKGYSTKGTGRGLGLNKVMKLKEKYGGELIVEQENQEGENWIVFEVHIPIIKKAGTGS